MQDQGLQVKMYVLVWELSLMDGDGLGSGAERIHRKRKAGVPAESV